MSLLKDNEQLKNLFRYNLMTKDIEFIRKAGIDYWNHGDFLIDEDLVHLKEYIAVVMDEEFDKKRIEEAVMLTSKRQAYNPLRQYLDSLKWDGEKRLEKWLVDICGCDDNPYTRDVATKTLCGAVARAYNPGTKFDYMLILEGSQGIGKSTLVEILGGEWYLDTHLHGASGRNDLINIMRTAWIMEISDMAGFGKMDIQFLKAFITRKIDTIRLPYDKRPQQFPRQCVMIGTLNPSGDNEYLKDDTGNRRFWSVECNKADFDMLRKIRDQLFAEAIIRWRGGEVLYLTNEESKEILLGIHSQREPESCLQDVISNYLMSKSSVSSYEIMKNAFHIDFSRITPRDERGKQTQIGMWMRKNGWKKGRGDNSKTYYNPNCEQKEMDWDD